MTQGQTRFVSFSYWLLCFVVAGYFIIHGLGLGSDKGYLSFSSIDEGITEARIELSELRSKRKWLEHRVSLIAEDEVDADLLSEIAREKGGLYSPDELIIEFN